MRTGWDESGIVTKKSLVVLGLIFLLDICLVLAWNINIVARVQWACLRRLKLAAT